MAPLSSDNVEWKSKLLFTFCMVVSLVRVVVMVGSNWGGWGFVDAMKWNIMEERVRLFELSFC
jgi:hypothetical protein